MKKLIALLCCAMLAAPALAQDKGKKEPSDKQKAQQERMKECNAKMGDRKGDDRQKAMSACLKGEDPAASKKQTQQDKMKDCNKKAEGKKGDERKAFMSSCLKG